MHRFEVTESDGDRDLDEILRLQRENLPAQLSPEESAREGFVTVQHTREALAQMHALAPSIVARRDGVFAGYALTMPPEARACAPILAPMFQQLDERLAGRRYYVMGQICIARPFRGQGLFDHLYAAQFQHCRARWDLCVTEVSLDNPRSLRAHQRLGFTPLSQHDRWVVLSSEIRGHHTNLRPASEDSGRR